MTLEQLRQSKPKDLRQLFIVDAERRLTGIVDIHDLLIAEPTDMLKEISRPPSATVSPFDDRDEVAEKLRDFQLDVLPVIDIHGRLIGVIRHEALLKTLEEAASVDIQMMVGAGREERALSRAAVRRPQAVAVAANQSRDGVSRRGRRRVVRVDDRAVHGARRAAAGRRGAVR